MSPTRMSMPYGSNRAKAIAGFAGSSAVRIRPPSSGGIGSRLNSARNTLIITEYSAMTTIGRKNMVTKRPEEASASAVLRSDNVGSNVRSNAKSKALATASSRFIPGPAAAVSAMSRRG